MITTITILVPLLGAVLMLLLPDDERLVRYAALAVAAVPLLLATYIYFAYGDDLGAAPLTQNEAVAGPRFDVEQSQLHTSLLSNDEGSCRR